MATVLADPVRSTPQSEKTRQDVRGVFQKLLNFDLSDVKRLLVNCDHIAPDHVEAMEMEYKKYIAMVIANPHLNLPISTEVDKMWHAHILTTMSYQSMCREIAGRDLHHVPSTCQADLDRLYSEYRNNTVPMLLLNFGSVNPVFWPNNAAICQGPYVCQ